MTRKGFNPKHLILEGPKNRPRNVRKAKHNMSCDYCGYLIPKDSYYEISRECYYHLQDERLECSVVW